MIDDDEEYFPRGGTSKTIKKKGSFVFGPKKANQEPTKKPGKRERSKHRLLKKGHPTGDNGDDEEEEEDGDPYEGSELMKIAKREGKDVTAERSARSKRVQMLSYQNIVEDMVVLCTVNSTHAQNKKRVQVALPERLLCYVNADDMVLNDSLGGSSKVSAKKRSRLPKIGSVLACRIRSCKNKDGDYEVLGSTNPVHVNSTLSFSNVHVGSVFLGAIKEIEDYGFLVFSGIKGLTAFLPHDNCVNPERAKKQFYVGKLVWCVVVQSKMGESTNTVTLSTKPGDFKSHRVDESHLTPESVVPGMELDLTVTKHLGGDLEVSVDGTKVRGFVPRSHFSTLADDVTKFKIGSKLRGTILYKYPVSNIVAFSLRASPLTVTKARIENGTVFEVAEIVYHDKRGLGVKFDHNGEACYGVVSKRKMEGTVESSKLEEMFPRGNHLSVVVVGYHHIDQLYSCSTQNDLLSGKLLGASKKKEIIGKPVTVVVKEKTESGLKVTWEGTTAFVPWNHVSDVVGAKNILKSIQINSSHKGRVFQYNPQKNSLTVTLRPTLVNNKPLVDLTKAVKGDAYWGVVNAISDSGISVAFFNNLKANIDQENLMRDCRKYKVGELVKCFVIKEPQKTTPPVFSLLRPLDQMLLSVGTTYKMIVKSKSNAGVECLLEERKNLINVFIPLLHLSDHESLRKMTLDKLTPGTTVDAVLFCFDRYLQPVFTLRESVRQYFKAGGSKLLNRGYMALKVKGLMPVVVSEEVDEGFYVAVPVPMFNRKILVEKQMLKQCGKVTTGDVIWLAVSQMVPEMQGFGLAYPDPNIYGKQLLKWAVSNLLNYINEVASFQKYKAGQTVSAVGTGVKNQCKLSDGRLGHITGGKRVTVSAGQPVDVIFLEEDAEKDRIHLLLVKSNAPSDEETQVDANDESPKRCKVVLTSEKFYVCRNDAGKYSLCPRFLHPNSSQPGLRPDSDGTVTLQEVQPFDGGLMIGCPPVEIFSKMRSLEGGSKTKKKKKRRSLVDGKPGVPKKKAKTTVVSPSNSKKKAGNGKLRKKKSTMLLQSSSEQL